MQAYRCIKCQAIFLTGQDACGHCGSQGELTPHELADDGVIITFSTVHKGAGHLAEPYTLAVIQLDEDYQVLARIESDAKMSVGQRVRYLRTDDFGKIFGTE